MKKRVLFVLLTIVLILPFIKVKAGSMDSYVDWTLDRSVFAHQYRNGSDHITNLAMMTTNGVTAYCIEPGITADKASYYSSTTNIYDTKLKLYLLLLKIYAVILPYVINKTQNIFLNYQFVNQKIQR